MKSLLFSALLTAGLSAHANLIISSNLCLKGDEASRRTQAEAIFKDISQLNMTPEILSQRFDDESKFPATTIGNLNAQLFKKYMRTLKQDTDKDGLKKTFFMACGFDDSATFDTPSAYIEALTNHYKAVKNYLDVPGWIDPDLKIVIEAQSETGATIEIDTTPDGFIFKNCEGDDGNRTTDAMNPGSKKCQALPLKAGAGVFIPISEMMKHTDGVPSKAWSALKALAGTSLMFLAGFPEIGIPATVAQVAINVANPAPLNELLNEAMVARTSKKMIRYGKKTHALKDGHFENVTLYNISHDDLKAALDHLIGKILTHLQNQSERYADRHPNNPNLQLLPGYRNDIAVYEFNKKRYGVEDAADPADPKSPTTQDTTKSVETVH